MSNPKEYQPIKNAYVVNENSRNRTKCYFPVSMLVAETMLVIFVVVIATITATRKANYEELNSHTGFDPK